MTSALDVVAIYKDAEENGIALWIDGGWGVDALLRRQTRKHEDLDLVVQWRDVDKLRRLLSTRGYREKGEPHARPFNYLLVDESGHEIDLHIIELDARGNGIYGDDHGESYTAHALSGHGLIAGYAVSCIAPEELIKFHTGYPLTDKDFHDVSALCKAFDLEMPVDYEPFLARKRNR